MAEQLRLTSMVKIKRVAILFPTLYLESPLASDDAANDAKLLRRRYYRRFIAIVGLGCNEQASREIFVIVIVSLPRHFLTRRDATRRAARPLPLF